MVAPNIPLSKQAGLPVDLERLAAEGDSWLTPEDRYALKTHGVCTQLQDHVFMVRVRVPGGVLPTDQARGLAGLARRHGEGWVHLTTRQNAELHWVADTHVKAVIDGLAQAGLSTRSTCGHTLRNVMSSEDAGVALDEPFDCLADARQTSDAIVARSEELNVTLPSRINITFGGSPRCREDALLNDAGFVSVLRDGEPGYELWAAGSLGKAPSLAIQLSEFVPRAEVLAASEALIEVFVRHGNLEKPSQGRLKFCIQEMGEGRFRLAWLDAFEQARRRPHPEPAPVEVLDPAARTDILRRLPPGGWSVGVRPQRTVGLASVTIDVPLGDTSSSELELLADLADRHADGFLVLGRDQDVVLRNVLIEQITAIRTAIAPRGLHLKGEGDRASVRACTGSAVCALGISASPETGRTLLDTPGLARNSALRVHVSGCPNSCAQHQAGDIGLSGTKVRIAGKTRVGYHLYLGADLARRQVGEVVGRLADDDVPAAIDAVIGIWEALRRGGETLSATVARVGADAFAANLEAVMEDRWATGPEPADPDAPAASAARPASAA